MRLHLTLFELEEGSTVQTGPTDRMLDLEVLARQRRPVAINPIQNHDHGIISAVLLTEDSVHSSGNALQLTFKPFWCKTFTLCSAKKDSLLALIMEFEDGQYWVDRNGWHECHLTLDGPGTDPKVVYNSQFMLGELLANYPRPHVVDSAIELIGKKYLPA